jgi:hypothetical protein
MYFCFELYDHKLTSIIKYHTTQYPMLSQIAHDYLAIQGSSVPSECAFSSGGLTGTLLRNQLSPRHFEALQILKSAYKHGIISAEMEARKVLDGEETVDTIQFTMS